MSATMSGAYRTSVAGVPYNGYMTPEGWAFPTPTGPFMPPYLGPARPGRDPTSPFGPFPYVEFHSNIPPPFGPSGPYGATTSPFPEPRSTAADAVAVAQALIDMTKTTNASTVASPSSSSDTLTSNNTGFTADKQPVVVDDQRNLIRALTAESFQPVPYHYPDAKPIVFPPGMVPSIVPGRVTPESEGVPVDEDSYKDSPLPVPGGSPKKRPPNKGSNICQICGKSYARPSTLKTHMRTHSGEKPYRCNICSKAFTQAANLTAHLRTHSGEKPFSCPMCQKRFSQSSSVTTHLRTHSGERPYRCDFCGKCFADTSTLTKHKRIHTGDKPYRCKICNLGFSQSGNLHRHMKTHSS